MNADTLMDVLAYITPVLLICLIIFAVVVALWARAVRVDRLHRQVLGSRATLESQLLLRAGAAEDVAMSAGLDPASAMLISRAAHTAMNTEGPLVDDGLDPEAQRDESLEDADPRARASAESDLSRVLRTVLDESTRAELEEDEASQAALARLDRASYRLALARSFHNTHVAEARRLRSTWIVKLFHLAGRAPMPATFDMDDLTSPEAGA